MKIIKRNAIKCLKCGDIIESKTVHDWVQCSCGACYVDGGHEYIRIGGDIEDIEMLTEYEDVPGCTLEVRTHYGSYKNYEVEKSRVNDLITYYEDQWDYVRVSDENGVIYKTDGYDK